MSTLDNLRGEVVDRAERGEGRTKGLHCSKTSAVTEVTCIKGAMIPDLSSCLAPCREHPAAKRSGDGSQGTSFNVAFFWGKGGWPFHWRSFFYSRFDSKRRTVHRGGKVADHRFVPWGAFCFLANCQGHVREAALLTLGVDQASCLAVYYWILLGVCCVCVL